MTSDITLTSGHRVVVTADPNNSRVLLTITPPDGGAAMQVPFDALEADDHTIIFGNAADDLLPEPEI